MPTWQGSLPLWCGQALRGSGQLVSRGSVLPPRDSVLSTSALQKHKGQEGSCREVRLGVSRSQIRGPLSSWGAWTSAGGSREPWKGLEQGKGVLRSSWGHRVLCCVHQSFSKG